MDCGAVGTDCTVVRVGLVMGIGEGSGGWDSSERDRAIWTVVRLVQTVRWCVWDW